MENKKTAEPLFVSSSYIALQVRNRPEAVKFYTETLGIKGTYNPAEPECEVILKHGGISLVLDECQPDQDKGVGHVFFEFFTANLEEALLRVKAAGCELGMVTSGPDFRGQMVRDPYGMKFHLYQRKEK